IMAIADFSNASIQNLISLEGRTAIITGGARGIGLAIAKRLMEAGANIVIADIDTGNCLDGALKQLESEQNSAMAFKFDTREMEEMENAAQQAIDKFGRLDIWINDAGIIPSAKATEITQAEWNEVIDINITGVFNGSQAAIPHLKKHGGVILNLSAIEGLIGSQGFIHYSASKYAVRGLTATLAKELGEYNIRAVAIAPTITETPGIHEYKAEMDVLAHGDIFKQKAKQIPLGRIGHPDDIARAALFLVSDMASFISGTTLVVDGGHLSLG
ncbi:MAG: Short-chain dehydrogenase/reductase, family, partial [Rickettsiaceae bacterium]|nr:Short-chain dehydrogenase/reductase, family [Rickettsiaceae bacterium]